MSKLISAICCDSLEEMNALCGEPNGACFKLSFKYKPFQVLVGFFFFFFFLLLFQLVNFQDVNACNVWRGFLFG